MRKLFFLPALFLLPHIFLNGQNRWDRPMRLVNCSVNVKADVFTATTFIEMEFFNPNKQEIEGLYTFQLKPGQVVTAFQLDLFGKYRDGSIEEKWKATNAYNTIVGKRVDPALLTWNADNSYSLRIYPVPANGSRKITMTIQQVLKEENGFLNYFLPLNVKDTVESFNLSVSIKAGYAAPFTKPGLLDRKSFSNSAGLYTLHWPTEHIVLNKPVAWSIPVTTSPAFCSKQNDRIIHFALRFKPSMEKTYAVHPKKIVVYWDASSSAGNRDIKKEISFLKQFIAYHRAEQITILPFNHKITDTAVFYTKNNHNSRWDDYLEKLNYDGATQLGILDFTGISADMFFVFSDGINSFGKSLPKTNQSMVYCVHAAFNANTELLKKIAGTSGGQVIDLNKSSISAAILNGTKSENWLINITSASGKMIFDNTIPARLNPSMLVYGVMHPGADTLYLHYGNNSRVVKTESILVNSEMECNQTPVDRLPMLINFESQVRSDNWEDVLDFGLREKVVTPNTAFIVLEKVEDYIKYNITPPKELEEECERRNYTKKDSRTQRGEMKKADEYTLLNQVINSYNTRLREVKANTSFVYLSRQQFETAAVQRNTDYTTPVNGTPSFTSSGKEINIGQSSSNLSEVVVTGFGITRAKRSVTYSTQTIRGEELNLIPQTNVVDALAGKVAGVQVRSQSDALLNKTDQLRIRGGISLNDVEPLYVVDGTPVSAIDINPADIESINILKGANATALYGSRAFSGAVVISSRKKNYYRNYYSDKPYRLKDEEDVEYMQLIKQTPKPELLTEYYRLRKDYGDKPVFYFDMAQHFFEKGLKRDAMEILMNAAEKADGNMQVLRAMGFMLESWKEFDEAINVYRQLTEDYPLQINNYRDLALACYQNGNYQLAIETLYSALLKNNSPSGNGDTEIKTILLTEMNAIIAAHKKQLDISVIPASLMVAIPADLRIVLNSNKTFYGHMAIHEPSGENCSYQKPLTKTGRMIYPRNYWYNELPMEYFAEHAKNGKYKIRLNYYSNYYGTDQIPSFIRIMKFKNFGRENQALEIENVIMDNQYGDVEIATVQW
jgi:TonB-dependent SusC/RagA subfamily outer membrane receptor